MLWRASRWPFVIGLALASWLLGFLGYRHADGVESPAYAALQLFALEGEDIADPPLLLTLARFLAPLAAGWAAVTALYAIVGDQVELALVRLFARKHVVVLGLGELGERVAKAFVADGNRVVAVEADKTNGAIDRCRDCGIAVVKGDATSPSTLRKLRLGKANVLVVACGTDAVNLDVMVRAAAVVRDGAGSLAARVHLDDVGLWRLLEAESLTAPERFPFELEFFNVLDEGARGLLRTHVPFAEARGAQPRQPHVAVVGGDGLGERVVIQTVRLWHVSAPHPDEALRITLVGRDADRDRLSLLARYPSLADLCRLEAHAADLGASEISSAFGREPLLDVTAAYVCLGEDTQALATALALRAQIRRPGVPIAIAVRDAHSAVSALLAADGGDVKAFGTLTHALTPEAVLAGTIETIAETMHKTYRAKQLAKGDRPDQNPSLVDWDDLPETLKQSNRRFAAGVGEKLRALHCALVPAPLAGPAAVVSFSEQEIERIAELEHERWDRDLRKDGWLPTTGPKDPEQKRHPLLGVPWDELSEADRDKDRDAVRALPSMLPAAGFAVYRLPGADPEPQAEPREVPVGAAASD
jgi:hypothetical protein